MKKDLEDQLRSIFREEAVELIDELRHVIARLRTADVERAREEIGVAMRLAHNLKGAAGSVGLDAFANTAHALEDALLAVRQAGVEAVRESNALLGEAVAALEASIEGRGDELADRIRPRLQELAGAASPDIEPEATRAPAPASDAPRAEPLTESSEIVLPDGRTARGATVRIEAKRLDRLFGLVSELLVSETEMRHRHESVVNVRLAFTEAVAKLPHEHRLRLVSAMKMLESCARDHERAVGAFSRLSSDLNDAMRRTRMVPLANLAAMMRRTVDDAARILGKEVDLELELSGIELDKVVLDRLRDPLVHLLRNSVDHGIESGETRDSLGKTLRGLVVVRAELLGSSVRLQILDDGRGIDVRRLEKSVVAKGLLTAEQAASLDEAMLVDFLFAEGFSTREQATMLSGRGVGLDVVRRAVAELGGTVHALPRGSLGGAAFTLTVPLSVLTTRLLLVRANDTVYALPTHTISRVARASKDAMRVVDGVPVFTSAGEEPFPLQFLGRILGARTTRESDMIRVIILEDAHRKLAVAVDEILEEQELVVRKLPWNLVEVPGVSGAVILADGTVAVAVDIAHLFAARAAKAERREASKARTRILVVDDSMTTRTLHRTLLTNAGYEVVLANDGLEAWDLLRTEAIDMVVTDGQMPGMDGFELTQRIRAEARLAGLPVILVTSLARPDDVQRGLDAGADEYVVKGPLEQDALLTAVARHVG